MGKERISTGVFVISESALPPLSALENFLRKAVEAGGTELEFGIDDLPSEYGRTISLFTYKCQGRITKENAIQLLTGAAFKTAIQAKENPE